LPDKDLERASGESPAIPLRVTPRNRLYEPIGLSLHMSEIMTRTRFIPMAIAFALPVLADTTVFPTGAFPADVVNVQAAVAGGGTILLKAVNAAGVPTAFNFGPPVAGSGNVELSQDVAISGETPRPGVMTTIRGGTTVFHDFFTPVKCSITGIYFDNPRTAALRIFVTAGAVFSHNRVRNIVGFPLLPGLLKSQAVWVTGFPAGMSGEIVIEDNVIEHSLGNLSYGLAILGVGSEVRISRNAISDVNTEGILVGSNTRPVTIEDNVVVPGPGFDPVSGLGNGIQAGPDAGGSFFLHGNTVQCENPQADGILLVESLFLYGRANFPNSVVENNNVNMHNSVFGGISLYGTITNALIKSNRVSGDAAFALDVQAGFADIDLAEFNTFLGNNISSFHGTLADVFFDANAIDNVLVGDSGTVIDLGVGDRTTGFTPMGHATIGRQIQAAQVARRGFLQSLIALERAVSAHFEP
jgi:hypothetical protein